jgi:hypothetical protein
MFNPEQKKAMCGSLREFIMRDSLCHRYFDVFLFENIPARDRNPDSVYLEEVRKCDVYVCLLGDEYGTQHSEGISATEREFHEATRLGKTRLFFIKDGPDAGNPACGAFFGAAQSADQ